MELDIRKLAHCYDPTPNNFKNIQRDQRLKPFFNSGINVKFKKGSRGIIIVENEYYYALLSGKWKKIGRDGNWESRLPPKKFIDYVLRAEML